VTRRLEPICGDAAPPVVDMKVHRPYAQSIRTDDVTLEVVADHEDARIIYFVNMQRLQCMSKDALIRFFCADHF
jgi:hypothetical protein